MIDYYELLQISPNADNETIHRVFKYLAGRLHPDNAHTGNAEKFQLVKSAYDVLSSSVRRREYDSKRKEREIRPLSTAIDFMDQFEGEINRRMAVLAVLYYRRRMCPNFPEVTLAELEERMGFPRDYLDFTLWYLAQKKLLHKADNACFALTAEGVDFVEKERVVLPILNGLLTSNSGNGVDPAQKIEAATDCAPDSLSNTEAKQASAKPATSTPDKQAVENERRSGVDRRHGAPDLRIIKVERRVNTTDRRASARDHQASN